MPRTTGVFVGSSGLGRRGRRSSSRAPSLWACHVKSRQHAARVLDSPWACLRFRLGHLKALSVHGPGYTEGVVCGCHLFPPMASYHPPCIYIKKGGLKVCSRLGGPVVITISRAPSHGPSHSSKHLRTPLPLEYPSSVQECRVSLCRGSLLRFVKSTKY